MLAHYMNDKIAASYVRNNKLSFPYRESNPGLLGESQVS